VLRQKEGSKNKEERLLSKERSLSINLPNQEELELIHRWFVEDKSSDDSDNVPSGQCLGS